MSNLKEAMLKVTTSKGAFDSEYAVQINLYDGDQASLFTDKHNIKSQGGNTYMKVHVLHSDAPGDRERLLLPSETFETSSRWLDVNRSEVEEVTTA